jgi:putative hydroxymethylpyrimidine transport system substrate-binding protein
MKKALSVACLALASAFGLSACGERHDVLSPTASHSLSLMLDYFPNADHVGIYQAQAEGDFRAAGLDVHIQVPGDPSTPLKLLAAGKVDVAVSYEPELMLARDKGQPLVSIAALVQQPLTSIVSIGAKKIHSPSDLRGKTVGDAGIPYQHAYLQTIIAHAGLPAGSVKEVNVGFNLVPAMISGKVDATLGAFWNYEAIQLAQQRKNPNVIRMQSVGVPNYDELVVVVTRKTITTKTAELRQLIYALGHGYAAARTNPSAAVANLVRHGTGLDPKLQLASVTATLPAFFPTDTSKPWGWQDQSQWNAYGQWMLTNHLISNASAVADASTNELLAGQGPPTAKGGTGLS